MRGIVLLVISCTCQRYCRRARICHSSVQSLFAEPSSKTKTRAVLASTRLALSNVFFANIYASRPPSSRSSPRVLGCRASEERMMSETACDDGLSTLSIREIKKLLIGRGIDPQDCYDKLDFVELLRKSNSRDTTSKTDVSGRRRKRRSGARKSKETQSNVKQRKTKLTRAKTTEAKQRGFGSKEVIGTPMTDGEARAASISDQVVPSVARIHCMEEDSGEVIKEKGSGVVWDKEGHIVTNLHVIEAASSKARRRSMDLSLFGLIPQSFHEADFKPRIKVFLGGGLDGIDATVVGYRAEKDLAILKILPSLSKKKLVPIRFGTSSSLMVGQSCLALGCPGSRCLRITPTTGIISGLGRNDLRMHMFKFNNEYIQHDAKCAVGSSGGPLLDSNGRLIGINSWEAQCSCSSFHMALPVDDVRHTVDEIIKSGLDS